MLGTKPNISDPFWQAYWDVLAPLCSRSQSSQNQVIYMIRNIIEKMSIYYDKWLNMFEFVKHLPSWLKMKPNRRTTQKILFHIFKSSDSASASLSSIEEKLVLCMQLVTWKYLLASISCYWNGGSPNKCILLKIFIL